MTTACIFVTAIHRGDRYGILYWPSLAMVPRCLHPVYALTAQYLREWDFSAAQRVDRFCANSRHIARRIQKHYRRGALVIYPPVDTSRGYIARSSGGYYLSVGRLSPTKRTDLLVDACTRLGRKLIVCGTGREAKRLKGIAGPTIEFVGGISDQQLAQIYANCRHSFLPHMKTSELLWLRRNRMGVP